ncbi:indoleamine 2,3-dioxygenase [Haladaptatus sp. DFWS20]|uniref:indoleamine 2,3-dioxygenase n=1 Tax=Haladaptatus sp. DFWS20 TaxID=3403467 RepID=UPI003EBFE5D9
MAERVATLDHERFDISPQHGFLPDATPLTSFGTDAQPFLQTLDEVGHNLPELLEADRLRPKVRSLSVPPSDVFDELTDRELARVYTVSGFVANAYVNKTDATTAKTIPAGVAVPLYESTKRLGATPVLSYDGYVLYNWTRDDPDGDMVPQNVRSVTNFFAPGDERWFIAIHVAIEHRAGPAIAAIGDAQQGVLEDDTDRVEKAIRTMERSVADITDILNRMPERNDPEMYGKGFRPYLKPLTGVEYEGVPNLEGRQSFRGASGAQSSILPALDAALGIDHGSNALVGHLRELRKDMPTPHRQFVEAVEAGPSIREYVSNGDAELREAYNDCIDSMVTFREHHVNVVAKYIVGPLDESKGTGGTPFSHYLGSFTDDTEDCRLSTS